MGFFEEDGGFGSTTKTRSGVPTKFKDEYETPPNTFRFWHNWMIDCGHRGFNRDPCSSTRNHKTPVFCTKRDNGLLADAGRTINFMNPPFSRQSGGPFAWTGSAVHWCGLGATYGALLPAWDIGDPWAVQHVEPFASELVFIEGHIKFIPPRGSGLPRLAASFASVFVLWLPGLRAPEKDLKTSWIKCPLE
jgi:hypothetical protein